MTLADVMVLSFLGVASVFALRSRHKGRKAGGCSGCSGCANGGSCSYKK